MLTWSTPSLTTRGSPSCGLSARPGAQRGLPGRSVAALNGPPHARGELYDEGRTRGIDGAVNWSRLDAETRKMIESGLELEDRIEAA